MSKRLTFTDDELHELRRALKLISNEDTSCEVNMDEPAVKAKRSALAKLNKATGWRDPFEGVGSVDVRDIPPGNRPFKFPKC